MNNLNKLIQHIISKDKKWEDILKWFKDYKCEDEGIQFIWDSLFTNKYLQSYHMYAGMLKLVLYIYKFKHDKTFPYSYSSKRVQLIQNVFATQFKLTEGTFEGQPFILQPNQVFKLSMLYGFTKKEKYKKPEQKEKGIVFMVDKYYDTETRKNGKSQFFAGLANFLVLNPFENDHKPEIYSTGPLQEASRIIYEKAQDIARQNPLLKDEFKAINIRRFETHSGGKIKDLPFEKASLEGKNPSFAIVTEYHLHKNDTMVDSIESAANMSRINSLLVFDTTKGEGIYGVAYNREMDYKSITMEQLENTDKIVGENVMTFMAEVDKDDNPEDIYSPWEKNPLRKSTPMLGITISLESLQQQYTIAKRNPTQLREFIIKKWGKWVGTYESLITIDDLARCDENWKDKFKIEDFDGAHAILAVDLANTGDTNAVSIIFKSTETITTPEGKKEEVEIPIIFSKVFIPEKTLRERIDKERKPYYQWIERGDVVLSGDTSVNHGDIASYISECIKKYNVKKVYYDPYQMHIIKNYLERIHGISSIYFDEEAEVKQNAATLSSAMEDYIKKITDGNIYFFGNPVFIDHHINMTPQFNSQGHIYWTKQKQENRVDIFATAVTGMSKFDKLLNYKTESSNKLEVWEF